MLVHRNKLKLTQPPPSDLDSAPLELDSVCGRSRRRPAACLESRMEAAPVARVGKKKRAPPPLSSSPDAAEPAQNAGLRRRGRRNGDAGAEKGREGAAELEQLAGAAPGAGGERRTRGGSSSSAATAEGAQGRRRRRR